MGNFKLFKGDVYSLEQIYFDRLVVYQEGYKTVENYVFAYTTTGELINTINLDVRLLSLMMSGRKGLIDISKIKRGFQPHKAVDYNRYKQFSFNMTRLDMLELVANGYLVHYGNLATILLRANVNIQDIGLVAS